ncbi:MAG: hypothetical protein HRU11_15345, partial [Parvularculaceae bacterium]|nr:hypothetical protein [Parvularculaceae bacterium]
MSLDDDAELVRLAYTLVVEPERFNEAVELLRERTDRILMEGGVAAVADFDSIAVHLNNARELMNRRGRRTDRSVGSSKNMQAAAHPVLLVTKDALVCAANDQAVKAFGIRIGSEIPHQCLEASVRQQLSQQLADLSDSSSGLLGVFQAHRIHPVGTTSQLALTMTRQPDGEIVGQLTTLSSYWVPHVGEEFARNLRLTKAELDVTKAIVTGESMEQLARRKQRALGTVRNQKKRLLSKLGLSSQVELACLFSGFAQLHFQPPDTQLTRPFAADLARQHGSISRTSGGILDYDLYGPRDGHPVLFLHSLLGGTGLTELQKKEVQKQGLRLIMPWRPFYGETTDEGLLSDHLERYANDIMRLMDSLGVAVCPVLSVTESAPYAFALAKIAPERFTELQLFGPSLP